MLLKTLLCRQGRDNALRIMAINTACYIALSLIGILFPNTLIILFFSLLLFPLVILSAKRRMYDSGKKLGFAWLICVPLLGFGLSLYFAAPFGVLAGLFFFGLASSAYLAFLPSVDKSVKPYVQGYIGPHVTIEAKLGEVKFRQEPTLRADQAAATERDGVIDTDWQLADAKQEAFSANLSTHQQKMAPSRQHTIQPIQAKLTPRDDVDKASVDHASTTGFTANTYDISLGEQDADEIDFGLESNKNSDQDSDNRSDNKSAKASTAFADDRLSGDRWQVDQAALKSGSITELLKTWLIWADEHRKPLLLGAKITAGVSAAVLIGYAIAALVSFVSGLSNADEPESFTAPAQVAVEVSKVTFPDGFELVLYDDILAFRWLGDDAEPHDLWRLDTAKGDKRCSELTFNNGSKYRPLQVSLLSDSATEAKFSPLDTQGIINDIALRGSVKLCGYNFSLTGSQSALGKNSRFSDFLSY
ncbi:hypothetical protein [Shewanella sp. SR44-3]|uniref:hypothetical protein n=1 Tax=unclassified Shewanella TaxID=196818 RepID=UPI0015FE5473|nr:hypothetical protein [Shewanella sp. SR44-3]MBB1270483.1 hypothetical protein [Shewanella sp. SR44-3]